MAKKKSVAYVGTNTSDISNLSQNSVQQIPNYEDSGVKYQGKFKQIKAENSFELKNQQENSIVIALNNNLAGLPVGNYQLSRLHPTQNFIINFISVESNTNGVRNRVIFTDSKGDNGFSIYVTPYCGGYSKEFVPKKFYGELININLVDALALNEWITVTLYGWYEDL